MKEKSISKQNRTLRIDEIEQKRLSTKLLKINSEISVKQLQNKIINQDLFEVIKYLPNNFVDLLFIDPPYNLSKTFNSNKFTKKTIDEYTDWLDNLIKQLIKILKPNSSIYVCGDWLSSTSIHIVLNKYFKVKNRITWEREKGRGAKTNWKNSTEDIWFCTNSDDYTFNIDEVKLKRKVLAPYKENGNPKDWENDLDGNFRLTHPSNIWTDITIPFWSMPENTEHPTQKPEKLMAKIIMASSKKEDIIFDPFLGSGTTAVVAKKLSRKFVGVELDEKFAALAIKRLETAEINKSIQGYKEGVFWERNTLSMQNKK
ncbi:MAG: site-specific DNA-methyltransferase [Ignavibacteriales bacterium]|nr:site-specific DNA-methyltransferase [Ignavibacteriales bacterium]